jgi:ribosomal protein S15P/S13E
MIKKAVAMRKHLEANRKDKDGKFHLILVSLPSSCLLRLCALLQLSWNGMLQGEEAWCHWLSGSNRAGWAVRHPPPVAADTRSTRPCLTCFHPSPLSLQVESRIHRLARYYKKSKRLPPNWK